MSYISVDHLCKTFTVRKKREKRSLFREKETVHALKDVSFEIEKGELVGYIGPNGAGKSTTVKILSGILVPDSGSGLFSRVFFSATAGLSKKYRIYHHLSRDVR